MRVNVTEQKAKERKFVYNFLFLAGQGVISQHPRAAPPPDEAVGNPATIGSAGWYFQIADVKPGPEAGRQESRFVKNFEQSFQVAQNSHKKGGNQAGEDGRGC